MGIEEFLKPPKNIKYKTITETAETQWHLAALAYLKALKKGYIAYDDKMAVDQIERSLYHLEKSLKRAFGEKEARGILSKAEDIANKAHIGSRPKALLVEDEDDKT
jgi:hypothetical protein